jgi:DNA ligase-1
MTMDEFLSRIQYPVLATPKVDGIRCITTLDEVPPPGYLSVPRTRSMRPVPNMHVDRMVAQCPPWLDGELTCGDTFQAVTSGIMSIHGTPAFTYHVFDAHILEAQDNKMLATRRSYGSRIDDLKELDLPPFCNKLVPVLIGSIGELMIYEEWCLGNGAEGVMIRPPDSPYLMSRSSFRRPYLVAIKRFEDSEALVLGVEPLMHNANTPEVNELGYQERSTRRAMMMEQPLVGALLVRDIHTNVAFKIGTGFTTDQRYIWWEDRSLIIGKFVKYRYQAHGAKDKPRIPSFVGIRDTSDMSAGQIKTSEDTQLLFPHD